jgi:hypothetical protein
MNDQGSEFRLRYLHLDWRRKEAKITEFDKSNQEHVLLPDKDNLRCAEVVEQ